LRPNRRHFQEVPADADKQMRCFCHYEYKTAENDRWQYQKQADLLFGAALCAQVRGIFADADDVARREVR
jgi:hypothetical protein